jgi:hypothetical protein
VLRQLHPLVELSRYAAEALRCARRGTSFLWSRRICKRPWR